MQDVEKVRAAFVAPKEFWSSPLYRHLSSVVAGDPFLVDVAASARSGQHPTFAFFGAIHALLLSGVEHELADYYPSVRGAAALSPESAGAALRAFVDTYQEPIRHTLKTRLVQTNHVQRALGLRLSLAAIRSRVGSAPVHVLEVGCSAGLLLRQAAYGYTLGGRQFGQRDSPVQLAAEWFSETAVPDLDALPAVASVTGIDLNPLDPTSDGDRLWLQALVWPEDTRKAELLRAALGIAVRNPAIVLAGDAIDLCPKWAEEIPSGAVRVVFHCATRMHVPTERRARFDAAIEGVGHAGPLYRVAIEVDGPMRTDPHGTPMYGLQVTDPIGTTTVPYYVEGHLGSVLPTLD
ncbi:MAG TPA: DUF2332 domain-containing protein [Mycobacterium sp.]